jgi:hypothetical protein
VKPPDDSQKKFQLLRPQRLVFDWYSTGGELQIVAASFHTRQASVSLLLKGKTPPSFVAAVVS